MFKPSSFSRAMTQLSLALFTTVALAAGSLQPAAAASHEAKENSRMLEGKHIAFLVGEGVHDGETFMPMAYLVNRGAKVTIIGVKPGTVSAYNSDFEVRVEKSVTDVQVDQFHAMVIPGGKSPAFLREHDEVLKFVTAFFEANKPVAAICHGPQVLIRADLLDGFRATGVSGISDELKDAGVQYLDEPVVRDRNLITSRVPDDLPMFSRAIEQSLVAAGATPD